MAYTINLTDGSIFATIADGTINTTSSMVLVGKNYAGYGEFLDENFIHLLENGSNTTAPGNPLTGQLWWDKTNNVMKVYNGTTFKVISAATASATQPTSNVAGDLWFDSTNQQLKVYNGSSFILVGPASTAGQGTSGAIVTTIKDQSNADHVILQFYVANSIVGIMSKDSTFTPQTPISGFSDISPGLQLSSGPGGVPNALFRGTATNASTLEGIGAAGFLSSTSNDTTSGTLGILNDGSPSLGALRVGVDNDFNVSVGVTGDVLLQNLTSNGNLTLQINQAGNSTPVMAVNGSTGVVSFPTTLSNISVSTNTVTCGNIVNANGNGIGNIGSSSSYFNTIFATATSARYADVAERFASDEIYAPGTVVELGGSEEITKSDKELSESVFGVISTRAAYLMNSAAGTDETHPPVAMTGRVPVRTVGAVHKGDRLVSAGNGLARAALPGEATAFNVIGRALADKLTTEEGMVEAIVATK